MNKQEYQKKIKNMKHPKFFNAITLDEAYEAGFEEAKNNALFESCFLDEPEKPVVPQYVADWYEGHKRSLEWTLRQLGLDMMNGVFDNTEMKGWLNNSNNKPIQTIVNMHQFDYEVEKEKLYTAQLKSTGEYLHYDTETDKIHHLCAYGDMAKNSKHYHFTEDTLLKYNAWGNDAYDVKEVKE